MHASFRSTLATFFVVVSMDPAIADPAPTAINPDKTFDKERFSKEVTQSPDLPNFHEVHPFLYRSGEPTEVGFKSLSKHNIKTVIDLRAPTPKVLEEKRWAAESGVQYINLPMSAEPPSSKQVETFVKTTEAAQADPSRGAVLVHCAHGSDRTGCLVGIWRVTHDGYTYPEAYKEMRHYWFTPKFTKLSGTVENYSKQPANTKSVSR